MPGLSSSEPSEVARRRQEVNAWIWRRRVEAATQTLSCRRAVARLEVAQRANEAADDPELVQTRIPWSVPLPAEPPTESKGDGRVETDSTREAAAEPLLVRTQRGGADLYGYSGRPRLGETQGLSTLPPTPLPAAEEKIAQMQGTVAAPGGLPGQAEDGATRGASAGTTKD